ncbi:hypothetical protein Moror_11189 [Moniliophthora roreri MCA 2997]|uniref:Uncharacterized protein n=1 Tax=Moniliophthora roreri (strain MCA 2997) TaxID=1381753 RepID=V2WM74_MONRO|nr:hypothetical protein Moror_11189 [Moniliophthora roreri MCA 2997]
MLFNWLRLRMETLQRRSSRLALQKLTNKRFPIHSDARSSNIVVTNGETLKEVAFKRCIGGIECSNEDSDLYSMFQRIVEEAKRSVEGSSLMQLQPLQIIEGVSSPSLSSLEVTYIYGSADHKHDQNPPCHLRIQSPPTHKRPVNQTAFQQKSKKARKLEESQPIDYRHAPPIRTQSRRNLNWSLPEIPVNVKGKQRQRLHDQARSRAHIHIVKANKLKRYEAKEGFDVMSDSRISSTGWQGQNTPEAHFHSGKDMDAWLTLILRKDTAFFNAHDRKYMFHSAATSVTRELAKLVVEVAEAFTREVLDPPEMDKNVRGSHWACMAGKHRNNVEKPKLTKWHEDNTDALTRYHAKGSVFQRLTVIACSIVRHNLPGVSNRFEACKAFMQKKFGLESNYDLFWNWCLNAPRKGVPLVMCGPHIDHKNLTLTVCIIFIYGHFNHKEKCYLVILKAGIVVELPSGTFFAYPSSIFSHWNIDLKDIKVVYTSDGRPPTPANSIPLDQRHMHCSCSDSKADHGQDWLDAKGRGSIVWFNQASMFQTSELGYNTISKAKAAGAEVTCNVEEWVIGKGIFLADADSS